MARRMLLKAEPIVEKEGKPQPKPESPTVALRCRNAEEDACQNSLSSNRYSKFSRPIHWPLRPIVVSVNASQMPSPSG